MSILFSRMKVSIIYVAEENSSRDSTQVVIICLVVTVSLILVAASIASIIVIIWKAYMKVHIYTYCAAISTNFLCLELAVRITNLLLTYFSRANQANTFVYHFRMIQ